MVNEKPEEWQVKLFHYYLGKPLIEPLLRQFKLNTRYSLDEIRMEVFIMVRREFDKGKLECLVDRSELIIVKIHSNGTREPIKNIKAWLRVIVFRHLIKCIKDEDSWRRVISMEKCTQRMREPIDDLVKWELKEKIQQLEPEDALILELFYFEDLTYKEIAERLVVAGYPHYSEDNLKKKKQRAQEKLRKLY